LPNRDTTLQQEGANLIDDTRTVADQPLPHPMQRLQVELIGTTISWGLFNHIRGAPLLKRGQLAFSRNPLVISYVLLVCAANNFGTTGLQIPQRFYQSSDRSPRGNQTAPPRMG
jgi:hypothetical protein